VIPEKSNITENQKRNPTMRNSGFGYVVLWLLGVPLSTLLLVWFVANSVGH